MNNLNVFRAGVAAALCFVLLGAAFAGPSSSLNLEPQRRGGGGGGGNHGGGGGGGSRGGGGGGGVAHANREPVRTGNFVSRPGQAPSEPRRQALPQVSPDRGARRIVVSSTPALRSARTFTKTPQGRHYDNGLILRKATPVTKAWQKRYFRKGHYHFPHYRGRWVAGQCFISPFGFYFGVCAPFISITDCIVAPPSVEFVDVPQYSGNAWLGYEDANDPNYLNDPNLDQEEPGLNNALSELTETFGNGDIDGLVSLVDPSMRVAIYEQGQYKYSMNSNDFVDLTRDAIQSAQTVSFTINYLHQRAPAVFAVDAQHVYRDASGANRTVYASFVLQDIGGQWTLTQVETSPDVIQNLEQ